MSQQLLYLTELYLNGLKPIRKAGLVRDTTLYPKPKALGVYGAISLKVERLLHFRRRSSVYWHWDFGSILDLSLPCCFP
jgi:hypothetical protein